MLSILRRWLAEPLAARVAEMTDLEELVLVEALLDYLDERRRVLPGAAFDVVGVLSCTQALYERRRRRG